MTWLPIRRRSGLWRFWLSIVHGFLGHPTDDREENETINTAWCGSCGATLGEDGRP